MSLPSGAITCIVIAMIAGIVIPVGLLILVRKKAGSAWMAFVWGCLVMLVFAMSLESVVHMAVYETSVGQTIWGNTFLYALYGGLMAGLFEETGRFLAFKIPMKNMMENDGNALGYAAGHGGFEAFSLLFFTMMNNLTYAMVMQHPDTMAQVYELATPEQAEQIRQVYELLSVTPATTYLVSIAERCGAILLQFGLTMFVWFAVKKGGKKIWYFPLAILLHAFVDGSMVLINKLTGSVAVTEIYIWVMAIVVDVLAYFLWKKEHGSIVKDQAPTKETNQKAIL